MELELLALETMHSSPGSGCQLPAGHPDPRDENMAIGALRRKSIEGRRRGAAAARRGSQSRDLTVDWKSSVPLRQMELSDSNGSRSHRRADSGASEAWSHLPSWI